MKVSVDSRYEVAYPDAVVKRVFDFYDAAPGWQSTLAGWPTDAVLIPRDVPVSQLMPSFGWSRVYVDREFEIYARPGIATPVADMSAMEFQGAFP